jgi:phosphopantothenoylcysteine decarboxylase/phosphopantothenate--cysteine ligase
MKGKKILLGITGSIAAFKMPYLVRLLVKEGAEVRIVMTPTARDFVTPLTLSTLSGHPVLSEFFDQRDGSWNSHVELGCWADVMVVAPVTATTLGKMANGIADNLLTASYLAARCPVFFAPAMDVDMYEHPSTSQNIIKLISYGNNLISPATGDLASGLSGPGRMEEPEEILAILRQHFNRKNDFAGRKVLVTAGPTRESLDPVRYLSNESSGTMGFCLAEEMAYRGAKVELISGPVSLSPGHPGIHLTRVISAEEMHRACTRHFKNADVAVMAAAVADFRPRTRSIQKIKTDKKSAMMLELVATRDILSELGKKKRKGQVLVGFALETENGEKNAAEKLKKKNLDLIVLNSLSDPGAGFGTTTNKVTIINRGLERFPYGRKDKKDVAKDIADSIAALLT